MRRQKCGCAKQAIRKAFAPLTLNTSQSVQPRFQRRSLVPELTELVVQARQIKTEAIPSRALDNIIADELPTQALDHIVIADSQVDARQK